MKIVWICAIFCMVSVNAFGALTAQEETRVKQYMENVSVQQLKDDVITLLNILNDTQKTNVLNTLKQRRIDFLNAQKASFQTYVDETQAEIDAQ